MARFNSTDRRALLRELTKGKDMLVSYLEGVGENDWDRDFGAQHYRGGPATIGRSLDSLTNDYLSHAAEILRTVGSQEETVKEGQAPRS